MTLISLPPFICDLFPLINLWLVVKLLTRHSFFYIMADRRDLRQHVIALIENGFSVSEAGRSCHVPLRTEQRWAHKFQNYGECEMRYSIGCPRYSTREEDEPVRWVDENSFHSANHIRAAANFPGSLRTVKNRLRDAKIFVAGELDPKRT